MVLWPRQTASHVEALQSHNPTASATDHHWNSSQHSSKSVWNREKPIEMKYDWLWGCLLCGLPDSQKFLLGTQLWSARKNTNHLFACWATCLECCRRSNPGWKLCLCVVCLELQAVASLWHPVHLVPKKKTEATLCSYGVGLIVF